MLGRARIYKRRDRDSDMTNPAGTTGQMLATPDAVGERDGVKLEQQVLVTDDAIESLLPTPGSRSFWNETMKGYWIILGTEISDQQAQAQYANLWQPIAAKYRARLNPLKVTPILREARDTQRVVVVEFPSFELAKACYDDDDYQSAKIQALKASNRHLLIIQGDLS